MLGLGLGLGLDLGLGLGLGLGVRVRGSRYAFVVTGVAYGRKERVLGKVGVWG